MARGQCEYAVESLYLNGCCITKLTLYNDAERLDGILVCQSFEYATDAVCKVIGLCSVQPVVGRNSKVNLETKHAPQWAPTRPQQHSLTAVIPGVKLLFQEKVS
jgi:hypothetical protein